MVQTLTALAVVQVALLAALLALLALRKKTKVVRVPEALPNVSRETLEAVIRERETWRELYFDQARGHDAAQALLLRERSRLAAQVRQLGGSPRTDPVIDRVRSEWSEAHGEDARRLSTARPQTELPSKGN